MADRITIEATGFATLSAIDRALAGLEKPQALMAVIGATLEKNIGLRFITKTDPNGAAWLPLAPSTLQRKNKEKRTGSILEETGIGKASLTYNAFDDYVEVGFGEAYMGYHEFGTQRMPRRQMLTDDPVAGTLGAQDQADILADVADYLNGLGL